MRLLREHESLTREEFADLTGIPAGSIKRYETGRISSIGSDTLLKITQNERFKKYTLWLMTGESSPEVGQISPEATYMQKKQNAS